MNTKKLVEKNLIWKIDDNAWARKCPKCNNIVHHEGMSSLEVTSRSYRKKCNCIRCNRNVTQQKKDLIRQQNIIKHFESINNPLLGFIRIVENKDGDISSNCVYGKNIIN